jgi:F0F1-type ATP synthase assembly protein I
LPARIIVTQIVIGGAVAMLLMPVGPDASLAALSATFAVVAPNAWFAWRLPRAARGSVQADVHAQARLVVAQGIGKVLLSLLLVAALVLWLWPEPRAFIGTLLALHGAYFLAPTLATAR